MKQFLNRSFLLFVMSGLLFCKDLFCDAQDILIIKTTMSEIALHADCLPEQKEALSSLKNEAVSFFIHHENNPVLKQFSMGYESFINFVEELRGLYTDEGRLKKIGAHHMRRLSKKAKQIA